MDARVWGWHSGGKKLSLSYAREYRYVPVLEGFTTKKLRLGGFGRTFHHLIVLLHVRLSLRPPAWKISLTRPAPWLLANSRDEWTVLKFPGDEQDALVVYGSSFIVFQSDAVTQLAAWLFIRWILSAENQIRWVQSTGLFPLRDSTMNLLADYSASHPQWAEAVKLLPQGKNTPQLASWRLVKIMLEDGFSDMFDTIRHRISPMDRSH